MIVEEAPATVRFPETAREVRVPTLVSEEFTTAEPRVVEFNTEVPLIK